MHLATRRLFLAGLASLLSAVSLWAAEPRRPAILFASPQGPCYGWLDLDYASELKAKGFEVDFTDSLAELTPQRIRRYNVLVIYLTPDAFDVTMRGMKSSPDKVRGFATIIDEYVAGGGGLLLMPSEQNVLKQVVADLTDRWGARLPVEVIEETDRAKLGHLTHSSHQTPLAWTDQVLPSPVSEGVKQVWYPFQVAYNAQMTGPIAVDQNWQVVLKGSATTRTRPVDLARSTMPELERPFARPGGVPQPDLFAIRSYKRGRIALANQWRQFSIGSGTRYIFQRQVLSKGFAKRPSDFGRLLENTYRWLAAPSLEAGTPGGYVTPADRLLPPNHRPQVRKEYADRTWPYDPSKLGAAGLPPHARLYRGLIGAKSTHGGGRSTVAQYAKAAEQAGLDFVVFIDEFPKLTREKLQTLAAECRRESGPKLLLLPGFSIANNIGNRMLFFSPDPAWVPDYCLTGPAKDVFLIQQEDGKGGYTGYITPALDWLLSAYHVEKGQVGYYHFSGSPQGMRMHDLRLYGMAAVRYYRQGKLVEDNTADYLTTAQCTIPPAPVSVSEVESAADLVAEAKAGHALCYAQARSPETLFADSLRWTHQYDAPNVSHSDGPRVEAWPNCHRVWTLGAEEFVTGAAVMPSPLAVTAEKGLKEIRLYNGQDLFRRFLPGGAKEFRHTLVLDGSVQKNIVLVAEDMAGGKAVTFARRCWTDGGLGVSFCSDHVNDGTMALAHGPYAYPFIRHPSLPPDVAGDTWDGGPLASLPLTGNQATYPVLESDLGKEDGARFDQIPLLEYTDQGSMAVASRRLELFDPRVANVVNPWHTYGPIAGPSKLMHYTQRYAEWLPPTVGVPQAGWAAVGVRRGTNASLFANEITFRADQTIQTLLLGYFSGNAKGVLVVHRQGKTEQIPLSEPGKYQRYRLARGDWFGFFSPEVSNSNLFYVRSEPIVLENRAPYVFFFADREKTRVQKGQTLRYEVAGIGMPVDLEIHTADSLLRYDEALHSPAGLQVHRGQRLAAPGLLELAPDAQGAAEWSLSKPPHKLGLTIPCRIVGLNPRWSAGLYQKQGYVKGDYGKGENRYRPLGIDLLSTGTGPFFGQTALFDGSDANRKHGPVPFALAGTGPFFGQTAVFGGSDANRKHGPVPFLGNANLPLYPELAATTRVVAGHPVVADGESRELFIQVTKVADAPDRWHLSVNNPTDRPITTRLRPGIDLPGLTVPSEPLTFHPGQYRVLQ